MPLNPGTRLGVHEVVALLGAGGMGEKESSGLTALILELVEGEDLAQRIARGRIPLDEALPIARQIAEALEAAHDHGIIHRDLKPANIKVRPDGTVKVLDFGLAKAMDQGSGIGDRGSGTGHAANSPTITTPAMTQAGTILGTAAYMAPEQARGKNVDQRVDIWAFGAVLYEMLAGRPVFTGDTVTDTLARILERDPEWRALPDATPPSIRRLLRRCLDKDVKRRVHAAADVRIEIEDALAAPDTVVSANSVSRRQTATLVAWLVATVAVMSAVTVAVFPVRRAASDPAPPLRFGVRTPPTTDPASFALSPDGRQLVFVATGDHGSQLWLRPLDRTDAEALVGTEGASGPFWAPDSQHDAIAMSGALESHEQIARLSGKSDSGLAARQGQNLPKRVRCEARVDSDYT